MSSVGLDARAWRPARARPPRSPRRSRAGDRARDRCPSETRRCTRPACSRAASRYRVTVARRFHVGVSDDHVDRMLRQVAALDDRNRRLLEHARSSSPYAIRRSGRSRRCAATGMRERAPPPPQAKIRFAPSSSWIAVAREHLAQALDDLGDQRIGQQRNDRADEPGRVRRRDLARRGRACSPYRPAPSRRAHAWRPRPCAVRAARARPSSSRRLPRARHRAAACARSRRPPLPGVTDRLAP